MAIGRLAGISAASTKYPGVGGGGGGGLSAFCLLQQNDPSIVYKQN